MERHGITGTLRLFGEPAEKVCGSKPVHAAHGYYDDLDAAISFHPSYCRRSRNTTGVGHALRRLLEQDLHVRARTARSSGSRGRARPIPTPLAARSPRRPRRR